MDATPMRCLTCGHARGTYSGGIVQGRPYCGTHLRAEMASFDHLDRERQVIQVYLPRYKAEFLQRRVI